MPFIAYNARAPHPGELLSGIKVPFMRANVWVPLRMEDTQPVVAIDDPHDLRRIDEIKALFPGRRLKFVVALKQDILDFIKLFNADEKEMAQIDDILSQLRMSITRSKRPNRAWARKTAPWCSW
jgi:hypothetical protein